MKVSRDTTALTTLIAIGILYVAIFYRVAVPELTSEEYESKEYRPLLVRTFEILGLSDQLTVGQQSDGKILVRVVNDESLFQANWRELRINAIAVRPDKILIGESLIALLVLESKNLYYSSTQSAFEMGVFKTGEVFDPNLLKFISRKHKARSRHFLLANIRKIKQAKSSALLSSVRSDLTKFTEDERETTSQVLAGALSLLLFHEAAHLSNQTLDVDSGILPSDHNDATHPTWEEDRADSVAVTNIKKLLGSEKRETIDRQRFSLGLLAYLRLLRDEVFSDILYDHRSLFAEDHLVRLLRLDCEDRDNEERKLLTFSDQYHITAGVDATFPILTSQELSHLRSQLLGAGKTKTHSHNFDRVHRVVERLEPLLTSDVSTVLQETQNFIDALNGDLHKIQRKPRSSVRVPVKSAHIISSLKDYFQFERGYLCPGSICWVGLPRRDAKFIGYMEIVEDNGGVTSVRLSLKLEWSRQYPDQYIMAFGISDLFLENSLGLTPVEGLYVQKSRYDFFNCAYGSATFEGDGFMVSANSTLESRSMIYDVMPIAPGATFVDNWAGSYSE